MKAAGTEFCWLRGKVGNNPGRDTLFEENAKILAEAGVVRSRYDFPFPLRNLNPVEQAKTFGEAALVDGIPLGAKNGEMPPAYDLEWPPPEQWTSRAIDADFIVDFALAQLAQIEADASCAPIVYSYPWFIASLAKAKNFASLLRYRLWIAGGPNYINGNGIVPVAWKPPVVAGWGDGALFWQWDGNGGRRLPGTNVDADFDLFKGTREEFDVLCKVDQPASTQPSPPPMEVIIAQAAATILEDGVHAYRQERADAILNAAS